MSHNPATESHRAQGPPLSCNTRFTVGWRRDTSWSSPVSLLGVESPAMGPGLSSFWHSWESVTYEHHHPECPECEKLLTPWDIQQGCTPLCTSEITTEQRGNSTLRARKPATESTAAQGSLKHEEVLSTDQNCKSTLSALSAHCEHYPGSWLQGGTVLRGNNPGRREYPV